MYLCTIYFIAIYGGERHRPRTKARQHGAAAARIARRPRATRIPAGAAHRGALARSHLVPRSIALPHPLPHGRRGSDSGPMAREAGAAPPSRLQDHRRRTQIARQASPLVGRFHRSSDAHHRHRNRGADLMNWKARVRSEFNAAFTRETMPEEEVIEEVAQDLESRYAALLKAGE